MHLLLAMQKNLFMNIVLRNRIYAKPHTYYSPFVNIFIYLFQVSFRAIIKTIGTDFFILVFHKYHVVFHVLFVQWIDGYFFEEFCSNKQNRNERLYLRIIYLL